jgi:hypothetical protein
MHVLKLGGAGLGMFSITRTLLCYQVFNSPINEIITDNRAPNTSTALHGYAA